jgi:2-oxoglutarate dehydrogenase complex dehydrogenase (E1) component-like enzyme
VAEGQAPFTVIDSMLSEEAVLGFEYGYSSAEPNTLVIWEAQFGDFANGAQVVIDQFIASGEVKWGRVNGLTLMLPHGYEGQGPEHSSARLERFMQLCRRQQHADRASPPRPARSSTLLRRQMVRQFRKPLIIFTPKSLLRNKDATSPLTEFTKGEFRTVIGPSRDEVEGEKVKRVIACSGKVAYDLIRRRDEKKAWDVAIVRVEQLYPFPHKAFAAETEALPERRRGGVVPGRAAEPGRLVLRPALRAREHGRGPEARLRGPPGLRLAGGGLLAPAPGPAEGAARPGLRQAQGLRPDEVTPGASHRIRQTTRNRRVQTCPS